MSLGTFFVREDFLSTKKNELQKINQHLGALMEKTTPPWILEIW